MGVVENFSMGGCKPHHSKETMTFDIPIFSISFGSKWLLNYPWLRSPIYRSDLSLLNLIVHSFVRSFATLIPSLTITKYAFLKVSANDLHGKSHQVIIDKCFIRSTNIPIENNQLVDSKCLKVEYYSSLIFR